jgi:hypothetical protein
MGRSRKTAVHKQLKRRAYNASAYKNKQKKRLTQLSQEDTQEIYADGQPVISPNQSVDMEVSTEDNFDEVEVNSDCNSDHCDVIEPESEDELDLLNKEDEQHNCVSELGQLAIDGGVTEQVLSRFMDWVSKYSPDLGYLLPKDPRTVKEQALKKHKAFTRVAADYVYIGIKYVNA